MTFARIFVFHVNHNMRKAHARLLRCPTTLFTLISTVVHDQFGQHVQEETRQIFACSTGNDLWPGDIDEAALKTPFAQAGNPTSRDLVISYKNAQRGVPRMKVL